MNEIEIILEKIMEITGRTPVSCQCAVCRAQCRRTPCLGTPQDIWALIEAGYRDKLVLTVWSVGLFFGRIPFPIPMVQALQTPQGCVFFKDELCLLHDLGLKPTEGRLSYHTLTEENFRFSKSLSWNVASTWLDTRNTELIIRIFKIYGVIG